eukprot:GFUD01111667.1.p1 GENE.GFUD01111667.1~~GFUD01111667.1.p1  ORF type:complete len:138 (+),score=38.13 GFUD01111667.1:41-454(+)
MSYSQKIRPSIERITDANKQIENVRLNSAQGASRAKINEMFDEAKQENDDLIEEAREEMTGIMPDDEDDMPAFNAWLDEDAKPMLRGTTKLLAVVLGIFKSAVVAIVTIVAGPVAGAVTKFFVDRAGEVWNFFKKYF